VLLPSLAAICESWYGPQDPSAAEVTQADPAGDGDGLDEVGDGLDELGDGLEDVGGGEDGTELAGSGLGLAGSGLALVGIQAGVVGGADLVLADLVDAALGLEGTEPGWPRQWTGRDPCWQTGARPSVTLVIRPLDRQP